MIELDAGWLLRLAKAGRKAALTEWRHRGSCIATTRVVIRTARYFGVTGAPMPMHVGWFTPTWFPSKGVEGHSVGIGGTGDLDYDSGSWDGHLVAAFARKDRTWIVDASADMFCRPGKLLVVEPAVFELPARVAWPWWGTNEHGAVCRYEQLAPLARNRAWRVSPDWRANNGQANRAVALAIASMKEKTALVA